MKCVYLSYDGLLDPLGQSQVLPYIERLAGVGHSFTVVSFEKERPAVEIDALAQRLRSMKIEWRQLPFRTGRMEFPKRVLQGISLLRGVCGRLQPDLVHLRGLMPAVIYQLSGLRTPHLYDFRGFALEEWTEIGKLRSGSLAHRALRWIDRRAVARASGLVVLEKTAEVLLRKTYPVPPVPLKVIRTCTDVRPVTPSRAADSLGRRIRFIYLGGARSPYRPDLALAFVAELLRVGMDCHLDFLNERDHRQIEAAIRNSGFPAERVELLRINHRDVAEHLTHYDCGVVFLDSSPWRRVCSPTKVGEFLAAGLPIVALEGIDMLEELAATTPCVKVIRADELQRGIAKDFAEKLVGFIRAPGLARACWELACRDFDLKTAELLYRELYAEIEEGLS